MSKLHTRIKTLEKRRNVHTQTTPQVIEIYGMRTDGTKYLSKRVELKDGCFLTVKDNKPIETDQE